MFAKNFFKSFKNPQRNEKGEMPIGPLLIIALIILPLVFLLISFKNEITTYFKGETKQVLEFGNKDTNLKVDPAPTPPGG